MCKEIFVIWEIHLMEMVERILLLHLESEMYGLSSESFSISDIQNPPPPLDMKG